jgi:hypothetical protein
MRRIETGAPVWGALSRYSWLAPSDVYEIKTDAIVAQYAGFTAIVHSVTRRHYVRRFRYVKGDYA